VVYSYIKRSNPLPTEEEVMQRMYVFTKLLLNRLSQEYWEEAADCRSLAKSFSISWEVFKKKIDQHFPIYLEKFGGLDAVAMGIRESGHSREFITSTYGINPKRNIAFSQLVRKLRPETGRATWKSKNINVKHDKKEFEAAKTFRCENCGGHYIAQTQGVCGICNYNNITIREA
jgi:hypothetical protein